MTEDEIIRLLTKAVRRADEDFAKAGGTSRHWLRDYFIPYLRQEGLKIIEDTDPKEVLP